MTAPVSIPPGHALLGVDFDAYENLSDVWEPYTVTWSTSGTQPVVGDGDLEGRYFEAGNLIGVRIALVAGSTTTFGTGVWRFSLPTVPKIGTLLPAVAVDASASSIGWAGVARIFAASASGDNMRILLTAGAVGASNTAPFTWAVSDRLILTGLYERG